MNYVEALDHPDLFGRWFADPSWQPWRTVERAIFRLPIPDADMPLYRELTGREAAPDRAARECWIIAGRRAAKSRKAATIAVYLATIGAEVMGYRERLAPGERGVVIVMAVDKMQARVTLEYARAYFREVSLFRGMVEGVTTDGVDLNNGMSLVVIANDFRSIRGRTLVAAIFEEAAFWRSDLTRNPDLEVFRAVRPGLATMPGSLLIGISSPYRRAGLLWQRYKKYWGKAGDVLVVQAPTEVLNPTIDRRLIEEEMEDDPEAAASEYLARFREDLSDFVRREVVEGSVSPGVYERPPVRGVRYEAFTDPSGGSNDAFTLGVAHREGGAAVLDVLRERRAPFAPEAVVVEFAQVLQSYGVRTVTGDRYAGEWPREQFRKRGVAYQTSEKTKSEIYLECLPLLNGRRVDLLDDDRLVNQICGLERRTSRGGKDSVDHAPHMHDDMANAALGVAWKVVGKPTATFSRGKLLGV